jgi:hypothetical protein
MRHPPQDAQEYKHDHRHHHSSTLTKILLGAGVVTMGIIALPYLCAGLHGVGLVSDTTMRHIQNAISASCGKVIESVPSPGAESIFRPVPTGWAADLQAFLLNIPFMPEAVVKNPLLNAVTSMGVGLAGSLIGQYVSKREDGTSKIRWGNVIKTATLATSFLIASPAICTGLSMGFAALGVLSGAQAFFAPAIAKLGSTGMMSNMAGLSTSFSAVAPHLISCGAPVFAAAGSALGLRKRETQAPTFAQREKERDETRKLLESAQALG